MHVVFVVDTSVSMARQTAAGLSLIDTAKMSIASFLKARSRDAAHSQDRYTLVSYPSLDNNGGCLRSRVGCTAQALVEELKHLTPTRLTAAGEALKTSFQLLNFLRLQTGIDHYGQGRVPWAVQPAAIIHITDGGTLTSAQGVETSLALPLESKPGLELTQEPFRWDQRIFTIFLDMDLQRAHLSAAERGRASIAALNRSNQSHVYTFASGEKGVFQGSPSANGATSGSSAPASPVLSPTQRAALPAHVASIAAMSDVTGGLCLHATNPSMLQKAWDTITSRLTEGIIVNFQPLVRGALAPAPRRLLRFRPNKGQKATGTWPFPEAYYPPTSDSMVPRTAHPVFLVSEKEIEPVVAEGLPFDKYEVEACSLTKQILSKRRTNIGFPCHVMNSGHKPGPGAPFGYLKPASNGATVNLIVLPYNFPQLCMLMQQLVKIHKLNPSAAWLSQFHAYLSGVPPYYYNALRTSLGRLKPQLMSVVSERFDGHLKSAFAQYLAKVKASSKTALDNMSSEAAKLSLQSRSGENHITVVRTALGETAVGGIASGTVQLDKAQGPSGAWQGRGNSSSSTSNLRQMLREGSGVDNAMASSDQDIEFDATTKRHHKHGTVIKRPSKDKLLPSLERLRFNIRQIKSSNFSAVRPDEASRHAMAIDVMGQFSERMVQRAATELRPVVVDLIGPSTPRRRRSLSNSGKGLGSEQAIIDGAEIDLDEVNEHAMEPALMQAQAQAHAQQQSSLKRQNATANLKAGRGDDASGASTIRSGAPVVGRSGHSRSAPSSSTASTKDGATARRPRSKLSSFQTPSTTSQGPSSAPPSVDSSAAPAAKPDSSTAAASSKPSGESITYSFMSPPKSQEASSDGGSGRLDTHRQQQGQEEEEEDEQRQHQERLAPVLPARTALGSSYITGEDVAVDDLEWNAGDSASEDDHTPTASPKGRSPISKLRPEAARTDSSSKPRKRKSNDDSDSEPDDTTKASSSSGQAPRNKTQVTRLKPGTARKRQKIAEQQEEPLDWSSDEDDD